MRAALKLLLYCSAASFSLGFSLPADRSGDYSGMYLPRAKDLPREQMRELGITVTPAEVEAMAKGTALRYGARCSGAWLSDEGLLWTNHHCLNLSQLKQPSDGDEKATLLETGFIAKRDRSNEINIPGGLVLIYEGSEDVSERFHTILDDSQLTDQERSEQLAAMRSEVVGECHAEDGGVDRVCELAFMNNHPNPYRLQRYTKISTIRLVWVPPHVLAFFGGYIDNWEYPRFAADFAFLRAYDSSGRPYRPTRPRRFSDQGVQPGSGQFILGWPFATRRNMTASAAEFYQDQQYWLAHRIFQLLTNTMEAVIPDLMRSDSYGLYHSMKNYSERMGYMSRLMRELNVVGEKQRDEKSLTHTTYRDSIDEIMESRSNYFPTEYFLHRLSLPSFPYLAAARAIWNANGEADEATASRVAQVDARASVEVERALLAAYFEEAAIHMTRPARAFLTLQERAGEGEATPESMATALFGGTDMLARSSDTAEIERARERRRELLTMNQEKLAELNDPLIDFVAAVQEELLELRTSPEYGAAFSHRYDLLNWQNNLAMGRELPDANSTLRYSHGEVKETYSPVYKSFDEPPKHATTTKGLLAKHEFIKDTSHPDYKNFQVPEDVQTTIRNEETYAEASFYDKKLGGVPVNFITAIEITGGSSGSSVYNAEGDIVGIVFDTTPEGVVSDVHVHPQARTIAVDVRYVWFLGTQVYKKASYILKEAGLPIELEEDEER